MAHRVSGSCDLRSSSTKNDARSYFCNACRSFGQRPMGVRLADTKMMTGSKGTCWSCGSHYQEHLVRKLNILHQIPLLIIAPGGNQQVALFSCFHVLCNHLYDNAWFSSCYICNKKFKQHQRCRVTSVYISACSQSWRSAMLTPC